MRCVSLEHERVTSTRLILEASQEKEKEEKEEEVEAMAVGKKCSYFSLFHFQGIPTSLVLEKLYCYFRLRNRKEILEIRKY